MNSKAITDLKQSPPTLFLSVYSIGALQLYIMAGFIAIYSYMHTI